MKNYFTTIPIRIIVGGQDSTPVRGVPYEPAVLLGESAEPRLSRERLFVDYCGREGAVKDCCLIQMFRTARKAEILRSR